MKGNFKMKNRNLAKILTLVLSLALLIGSVAAINVSAETAEIAGVSIVHGAKIQIAIAADDDATVTYKWGAEGETLTATKGDVIVSENAAVNGKTAYLTEGVAYYELSKVAYITVNGEEITYSVAQFLFAKIYRDKVGGNAQACYEALLALGDASQVHLNQNASALPSKSTYAYTNDADITINGDNFAFAPSGEATTVALAYNGATEYTGFQVGKMIVAKSKAGNVVIDGVCEVSLYTDEIPLYSLDFESDVTEDVSFYTFSSTGNGNPVQQTTITATSSAANYYGVVASLATDPVADANNVLKIVVNGGVNNSNTSGFNTYGPYLKFNATDKAAGGDIHVIEYDFYVERLNKAAQRNFMELWAYDTEGNGARLQNGGADGSTNGHTKSIVAVTGNEVVQNCFQVGVGSTQADNTSYALLDSHTWYRLRFVYDVSAGTINSCVSFDGGNTWYLAAQEQTTTSLTTGGVDTSKIDKMALRWTTYGHGEILYIDNINYYVTDSITLPTVVGNDSVEHPAN